MYYVFAGRILAVLCCKSMRIYRRARAKVITEILRSLKKLLAYIVHPTIPFTFAEKKRIWKSK